MIKIQIAAKAAWDGLLLLLSGQTLTMFSFYALHNERMRPYPLAFFPVIGAFLVVLLFFLRNFSLPLRLTGTAQVQPVPNWKVYFVKIYRLMCIFVGMILLCNSLEGLNSAGALIISFFPSVRNWITLCMDGNISAALEQALIAMTHIFYPFGFLLFCGYLVLGADSFIRWQIRMFEKQFIKRRL